MSCQSQQVAHAKLKTSLKTQGLICCQQCERMQKEDERNKEMCRESIIRCRSESSPLGNDWMELDSIKLFPTLGSMRFVLSAATEYKEDVRTGKLLPIILITNMDLCRYNASPLLKFKALMFFSLWCLQSGTKCFLTAVRNHVYAFHRCNYFLFLVHLSTVQRQLDLIPAFIYRDLDDWEPSHTFSNKLSLFSRQFKFLFYPGISLTPKYFHFTTGNHKEKHQI